jgi:uncharacterized membrane protein (UPF0127 family)
MRFAIALLFVMACAQTPAPPAADATPEDSMATPAAATGPRVVFPDGFVVRVELAADDELRAQGLMYRDQLRPGTGMLFLFAQDEEHGFWMKNTRIPLDMIWLTADQRIAGIREHVPPCTADPCPSYSPGAGVRSRYVLEVAGGVAGEHGLKVGDQLRFHEIEGVVIR